jgi:hypothetical protein
MHFDYIAYVWITSSSYKSNAMIEINHSIPFHHIRSFSHFIHASFPLTLAHAAILF